MKAGRLFIIWISLVVIALVSMAALVYVVDPYFHYHRPLTDRFWYTIDNQRAQNDGISRHFEYDAMITGTSMIENFKTTEMDEIYGTESIKLPYPGGSYKEINDNIRTALKHNPHLKLVIRGLDEGMVI